MDKRHPARANPCTMCCSNLHWIFAHQSCIQAVTQTQIRGAAAPFDTTCVFQPSGSIFGASTSGMLSLACYNAVLRRVLFVTITLGSNHGSVMQASLRRVCCLESINQSGFFYFACRTSCAIRDQYSHRCGSRHYVDLWRLLHSGAVLPQ